MMFRKMSLLAKTAIFILGVVLILYIDRLHQQPSSKIDNKKVYYDNSRLDFQRSSERKKDTSFRHLSYKSSGFSKETTLDHLSKKESKPNEQKHDDQVAVNEESPSKKDYVKEREPNHDDMRSSPIHLSSKKELEKLQFAKMKESSNQGSQNGEFDRRQMERENRNILQSELKPSLQVQEVIAQYKNLKPVEQSEYSKEEQNIKKCQNSEGGKLTATISSVSQIKDVLLDGADGFLYKIDLKCKSESGEISFSKFVEALQSNVHYHEERFQRREAMKYLTNYLGIQLNWNQQIPDGETYFKQINSTVANQNFNYFRSPGTTGTSEKKIIRNTFYRIKHDVQNVIDYNYLLYLYLGNCLISKNTLASGTKPSVANILTCALTERETYLNHRSTDPQKIRTVIFEKKMLCSLPEQMVLQLEVSNDATSGIPSVGSSIIRNWSKKASYDPQSYRKQILDFSEEVDGRISELLMMYYQTCTSQGAYERILNTPFRRNILNGDIIDLKFIWKHNIKHFVMITFKDGLKAIGKTLVGENGNEYIGDGLRELVGFHIDRALLINRFPHTARRRIFFNSYEAETIVMRPQGSQKTFLINNTTVLRPFLRRYCDQNSKISNTPFIDIVFVGIMKSLKVYYSKLDAVNSLILKKDMNEMENLTRQSLRDMTDVIIIDFLTHNFDRKGDNCVKSELRYIPFDVGRGFASAGIAGGMICEWLLQRPFFLHLEEVERRIIQRQSGPHFDDVPADCGSQPINRRLCTFSRRTVTNILNVGNRLSSIVKSKFTKEVSGIKTGVEVNNTRIFSGIEIRQKYLMNYIEYCIKNFGDSVFI